MPSGKGSTPTSSSVFVLYSRTCFCPGTAASGDQGLVATVRAAVARAVWITGSMLSRSGMGGGPSGRPVGAPLRPKSTFGFLLAAALLPLLSSAPPSIHLAIVGDLVVGEFFGLERHVGLGRCGRTSEKEIAVRRASRFDDRARAAAGHQSRIGRQVETGRLLIGVVAGETLLAEDGTHVVLVRHLRAFRRALGRRSFGGKGGRRDREREAKRARDDPSLERRLITERHQHHLSMIEQELARVQQRPERVLERLFLVRTLRQKRR